MYYFHQIDSYKSIVLDQCTKNLPKKTFETYIISCFDTGVKKLMNYNFDKDFKTGFVAWTTANSETIKKQVSDIFKRHARTNNSTDSWTFTDFCRWAL